MGAAVLMCPVDLVFPLSSHEYMKHYPIHSDMWKNMLAKITLNFCFVSFEQPLLFTWKSIGGSCGTEMAPRFV